MLLLNFNATKIPKKKDAIKFTIEIFWILNPVLIFKWKLEVGFILL